MDKSASKQVLGILVRHAGTPKIHGADPTRLYLLSDATEGYCHKLGRIIELFMVQIQQVLWHLLHLTPHQITCLKIVRMPLWPANNM
jgi:hypothetical protein